ncbi:MAG: response regulator [bacterium]|nr:MAG: response regulator [bacterium]
MPTILIAADKMTTKYPFLKEISALGHEVVLTSLGTEAMKVAQRKTPDLVILDIDVPGESGFDFLQDFLEDWPDKPVIIHSAYSHYKEHFMSWVAADFIIKSTDFTNLKKAILNVLK